MLLPNPRGPVSAALIRALGAADTSLLPAQVPNPADPLADEDVQLALWICFELHYRGFADVDDTWEWQPEVIALRRRLETVLLDALRRDVVVAPDDAPVAQRVRSVLDADDGPQLSAHMQRRADLAQFREWAVHRSVYQLKEGDPHTFAIPRLAGRAKAALVEIQADEYGTGRLERMHSELYRTLLRGLDLRDSYGHYVDAVPAITLAMSNVMSLFGLRRELRGALVGHLAAYEMSSSAPCRRYAKGLRRLGGDDAMCDFFDEHVIADALHEQIALHDLCGELAQDEPQLADDIVFGALVVCHVDARFAGHVLDSWAAGRSSLRIPLMDTKSGSAPTAA